MFIKFWRTLGLLAWLAGVGACQPKAPSSRDYLVISTEPATAWIRNFNPFTASTGGGRWSTIAAMFEPLMIYNRMQGKFVPWLATEQRWEDAEHRRLIFSLRPSVRWSDGQALKAEDVVFTFQLLKKFPALDTNGVWSFLEGVELAAPTEVRFRFQKPFAPGLVYIAQQFIVPQHKWQDVQDPVSYANEQPVATGPYTELNLFENQVYELGRNPYYWQKDKAQVKALRFPAFPSNEQVMLNLLKGKIDLAANFIPAVDRVYVAKNPENHHYWFPLVGNMVFLYLNNAQPPFDQEEVRKAVSRGIDRQKIVKVAMFNYTEPAHPSGMTRAFEKWRLPVEQPEGEWVRFQPEKAAADLDRLGFKRGADGMRRLPDGKIWSLDIAVVTGWSDWVRAAQIMSKNLQTLGIDARMRTYDFGAYFSQLQRGEFQAAISWSTDTVEPYEFYRWLMAGTTKQAVGTSSPSNWQRFADPVVDAKLAALASSFDEGEQRKLIADLQILFMQHAPAIPLFPNPAWGTANTEHFVNYPSPAEPYAVLSPNYRPEILQVLTELRPKTQQEKKKL